MKFIFSQSEHPNFENFLGSIPPDPINSLRQTQEFNRSLEKSGKSQGISFLSGDWAPCAY